MSSSFNDSLPKMTYRTIVCDDESYIANSTALLLKMQPAWELDVTVCTSPVSACQYIEAGRVDLLIADICMPGISGLDVMRKALALWPMCQVILLTAHPQFDYVYDAIQHDNVSYILKCDGHEALIQAVTRCIDRLSNAARQERIFDKAKEQARSALPYLQREYFLDLIHGVSYTPAQTERVAKALSLPFDLSRPFSAWIMLMQVYEDTFLERNQRMQLALSALSQFLPADACFLSVPLDSQRTLCLAQTGKGEAFAAIQLEGLLESLQQAAYTQMSLPFSAVYCPLVEDSSHLASCYERMNLRQSLMASGQEEMWLVQGDKQVPQKLPLLDAQYIAQVSHWRHSFENGDPAADQLLKELLEALGKYPSFQDPIPMEMYLQITLQITQILRIGNVSELGPGNVSLSRLMRVDQYANPQAAANALMDAVAMIRDGRKASCSSSVGETIEKVTVYIKSHLSEDISLTRLADHVGINASYLSRIFRKATGSTLISYISSMKMDLAYTLLRDPSIRIQQVSQALGFLTPAYFSYFFKKNAECTPSEYREINGSLGGIAP